MSVKLRDLSCTRPGRRLYLLTHGLCTPLELTSHGAASWLQDAHGDCRWHLPINNVFPVAAACRRCRANASMRCLHELEPGWSLTPSGHLLRSYEFRDFAEAMAFANRVGDIAEQQGHHPDLHVGWGRCGVEIWTHKIDGLTESDFFLAAKADRAFQRDCTIGFQILESATADALRYATDH